MPPPSFLPLHKTNFYLFYHHQLRFPHKWKIKLLSQNKTLGRRTKKLGEEHVGNIKLIMRFAMQALTVYIVIFLIFWKTKEVYYEKTKCYQFGWTVFAEEQETPRRPVVQSKKKANKQKCLSFSPSVQVFSHTPMNDQRKSALLCYFISGLKTETFLAFWQIYLLFDFSRAKNRFFSKPKRSLYYG